MRSRLKGRQNSRYSDRGRELSEFTARLMQKTGRTRSKWPALLAVVTDRLVRAYGTPTLGNFRDPVKEIFYILLSARTTERLYQRAHLQLFTRFATVEQLACADIAEVTECVKIAGLAGKRAAQVIAIAKQLLGDLGKNPATRLRAMPAEDAFEYLTNLPGVGPKSALCVMMCSLDQDVFPVDINVQRVFERMGVLKRGLKHYQAQQIAPKFVPSGRSKELHVGLVEHGRRVCLPTRPKCGACFLADLCHHGRKVLKNRMEQHGTAVPQTPPNGR